MPNKSLTAIIGMNSILFSTIALAASSKSVTKDEWLASFKEQAPAKMCRQLVDDPKTNKLLVNANISYDKCVALISVSFDKCKTKFYSELPVNLDNKDASTWGNNLGKCIGMDFLSNNLTDTSQPTSATPATTSPTTTKPGGAYP
ncbi:hypothetical protein [Legionella parisiensis]|uniref:T2SS substrate NttA domain-containing protein n=1 Tax=Legionella parisiensis TaxID=45071 RepID=A0A1E5JNC4_9GAMM|nr:hypothetical protein [Legionella parisiensis]KTD42845.1 hypothetical protein Lpar_0822 [Legionella parisiensis]OEH45970.1 hypothetical protein lpari_03021 [Legionella parisiensis]STX78081.1 Uncharacterised protein [Legionella parisiensis]